MRRPQDFSDLSKLRLPFKAACGAFSDRKRLTLGKMMKQENSCQSGQIDALHPSLEHALFFSEAMTRTKNKHLFDDKLCFKLTGGQYLLLEVQDLLYIEADREISYLNLVNGDRIATAHHLGYYKVVLLSQFGFLEASKSVLVNTMHVVRYRIKERTLQLTGGIDVVVANSKKEMVSEVFKKMYQCWEAGKMDITVNTHPKAISFAAEF